MNRWVAAAVASTVVTGALAQADQRSPTQIDQELSKRDALIDELRRRVEALEQQRASRAASAKAAAAEAAEDEEGLSRALERALVRTGGVLLRAGQKEIEPSVQYEYTRRSGLAGVGGLGVSRDIERDTVFANLAFRLGLPWTSQLEVNLPWGRDRVETILDGSRQTLAEHGRGDYQFGLSKQLLADRQGRSGLIANLTWQESSGQSNLGTFVNPGTLSGTPSLGLGYDSLSARLTGIARLDPLVFVGSLTHSFNRSANAGGAHIDPPDTDSLALRAVLAASPDVSLRTGFTLQHQGNLKVDGEPLLGSKRTVGLVELGTSISLSPKVLLDVSFSAGLTQDSPDFIMAVSLPVRF